MSQTGHICVPPLFLDSPGKPCMKWKGWLRAFENYIISIDGQGYSPERKKSLLFGLLGKAGQEVFDSLPVYVNPHGATAPLNEYQEAVRRLELQYAEECNIMVGRHKFALRKQEEGETIEEYIACLRVLAQDCEFAVMTDTYIRDQVVFYCHSKKVQERLLSCRNPSLKDVIAIAKAVERSMVSSKELANTSQASNVFYVQDSRKHVPGNSERAASDRGGGRRQLVCYRCGSKDHLADSRACPAVRKSCSKCRKLGHFAAVCKAKKYNTDMKVSSVSENDTDADADMVLSIDGEDGRVKGPIGSVMIGVIKLPFTADSGSPLTLISDRTFDSKWQDVRLHETDVSPKAFGEHDIVMKGYFWDSLTFRGRTVRTKIYVAENGRSLVGWKDLEKLGVMLVPGAEDPIVLRDDWVNYVQPDDLHDGLAEVLEMFDSVFENKVGCVRGFVHAIRLKKGALPIKHKVRTIPLSVRGELKAVLDKLKREGVIEEAGASEWVSAIVVSKKKRTGDIRFEVTGHTPFYLMRGRRCMSELTPKFNKWYEMNREIEAESDERLRVKARIVAKQENNKRYADMVNRAKTKNIAQWDWVLVKKPNRVMKGESVFQTPVRVQGVTRGAVCLEGAGWRSKDDIVRLKAGQEKIIMKDVRVDGAEGTDDVDEWQTHEARDVVIDEEECVNTPSSPGMSGQGSAERCEKAWRGLTAASGQNGCRPESVESDSHNVMGSSLEDACAVKANSLQYVTPSRPIRRIRAPKRFEDFVMRRLMTPRPICNEDGRDVRGRRGGEAEARTKRGVAAGRLLVGLISCGKNKRY
ncbi:hypothetical protein NDU88_005288 [Pleurodeles waltl]|uniref:CCHC-type domain-containing protein n=1 Tax=Pleurodeles waltl TaxID=8319 RepID=A0AAV7SLD7_PLEWA|nr:hypothetical protein NDU88_005288 [Pleurodeles waltl]